MEKIKLINASIGYLNQTIIRNITLKIEEKEIIGIFGPNGAGKTTLLCGINGLARIFTGFVFIDNIPLNSFTGSYLRRKIGYVPQTINVDPNLPILAKDVISIGINRKNKDTERFSEIIDFLEINEIIEKPFGLLSGGEMRKILIAYALVKKPEILLLDETFTYLDIKSKNKLKEKIKEIHKKEDLTILIVSHEIEIFESLCEKIVWLENGKLIFYGRKEEFLNKLKINGNN